MRTKKHPLGGFIGQCTLLILKSSNQDLSILKQLKVGHRVSQTWPFFDKLQILASYNNLRIGQEVVEFSTRTLRM